MQCLHALEETFTQVSRDYGTKVLGFNTIGSAEIVGHYEFTTCDEILAMKYIWHLDWC